MRFSLGSWRARRLTGVLFFLVVFLIFFRSALFWLSGGRQNRDLSGADADLCQSVYEEVVSLQDKLRQDSWRIRRLLEPDSKSPVDVTSSANPFTLSRETLRRYAAQYATELRYTYTAELSQLRKDLSKLSGSEEAIRRMDLLRRRLDDISDFLVVDLDGLGRVDGAAAARINELERLTRKVQQRLHSLQNPEDCSRARYLVASLNRPCGFGCNVHHLVHCFQLAYATGRTLLLQPNSLSYGGLTGWWLRHFRPVSVRCNFSSAHIPDRVPPELRRERMAQEPRVVSCPYIANVNLPWLPPAVPEDLASDLRRLHGYPFVWFVGQLTRYLMTPIGRLEQELKRTLDEYGIRPDSLEREPVVGLHVRRTDKINTEAAFHSLSEYMRYADDYFARLEAQRHMQSRTEDWQGDALTPAKISSSPKEVRRRVLIATDDHSVLKEARETYQNYTVYGSADRIKTASVSMRSSDQSNLGIALDILLLASSDFLVCTFSSQVCRIAYELQQTRHETLGDASDLAQSLDDCYYYGGQQASPAEVVVPDASLGFRSGDRVHVAGNHWDGWAVVRRLTPANSQSFRVPAFKLRRGLLTRRMGNHS